MKKRNSVFTLLITLLLAILIAAPVYAFSPPAITERVESGPYIPLRSSVYAVVDAEVLWQAESRNIVIIIDEQHIMSVQIDEIGFIENGISWVPVTFFEEVLYPALVAEPTPVSAVTENEENAPLWSIDRFSDIRDASFSTDLPHGEIAVGFIEYMSDNFAGRSAFTYTEKATAIWIIEELLAMGHNWDAIEVQEFDYWYLLDNDIGLFPASWFTISSAGILGTNRDYELRQDRTSQNVVLTIPGQSERFIIVGAHYDSVPYPGASDNASGVGLLLESAQRMMELDHYYTIVYVFFGAEEVGLFGAFYYYESLTDAEHENVVMMINADVLIEGPYPIFGAGMVPVIDDDTAEAIVSMTIEFMLENIDEILEQIPEESLEETLEEIAQLPELVASQLETMQPIMLALQGHMMGLFETVETDVSRRVDAIANEVTREHNVELIRLPEAVIFTSDNLAFAMTHTVVNLCGLERVENIDNERIPMGVRVSEEFAATILHSPLDEFNAIEYLWPGMMRTNMQTFSLLLEAILTASFS